MFRSFNGGIRFYNTDSTAKKIPIRCFTEYDTVYISMEQGGGTCKPIVNVGDTVTRGQIIGEPMIPAGLAVYCSVNGTVTDIITSSHPFTGKSKYIVINVDKSREEEIRRPCVDIDSMESDEIIELAHLAAIPGPIQYSEPEYVRMLKMLRTGVKNLVCGAVECEPYIGHSTRICVEYAKQVVGGLKLMMKAVNAENAYIALSSGSEEAERMIRSELSRLKKNGERVNIRLARVANKYPAASRLKSMFETRGIGEKPLPAGVTSPLACMSLYRAATEGIPVMDSIITLSGDGLERCGVYEVPIGVSIKDIISNGVPDESIKSVVMGGVMNGIALDKIDYSVLRCNTALLALTESTEYSMSNNCIHCNQCGKVCPESLSPSQICEYLLQKDYEEAESLGLRDCRLCGCCSYICPGRMELTEILKNGKREIGK